MKKHPKNVAASVRQRLYDRAKEMRRPFDELLQYYAMERFLYRLSKSTHRDKFVLKGALMFIVWKAPKARATKDMDFLARMIDNSIESLVGIIKEVCVVASEEDGIDFNPRTVAGERIKETADYPGVRVRFTGKLGQAKVTMQLDLAFGDTITPGPIEIAYPVILGMSTPHLQGYPAETVVAEKLEAAVKLGEINSRMKDFYDLWLLSQQFDFDGETLVRAIAQTFANRGTALNAAPTAFSDQFLRDEARHAQWKAFLGRASLIGAPSSLHDAISPVRDFLLPVVEAVLTKSRFQQRWSAPGPWMIHSPKAAEQG